jgi:hypothetical protein
MNPEGTSGDEYATKPPANLGEGFWLKKGTFKSVPVGHAELPNVPRAGFGDDARTYRLRDLS